MKVRQGSNDLFYIPAAPPTNTEGINDAHMANVGTVREQSESRRFESRNVFTDTTKNAPPVTARRNFGIGPMNGNVRRRP